LALPDNRLFALHDCSDLAAVQVEPEDMNHTPNHPAPGKAGIMSLFAIEHICPGLPEPAHSAHTGRHDTIR
jgi:hypothetical protein